MNRRKAAQRPRGHAEAGPDAKACVRAASRIANSTAIVVNDQNSTSRSDTTAAAEARAVAGSVMWLAAVSDWLADLLDRSGQGGEPSAATIAVRASDIEHIRLGLLRCVELLDTVTVDPGDTSNEAAPPSARGSLH